MQNKSKQKRVDSVVLAGAPVSQKEYQRISQWLDLRFHHSIGATAFLDQTLLADTQWKLLRLYDSNQSDELLGVAVILVGGTCFWLPEESSSAGLLCSTIVKLQPSRIATTSFGRDVLRSMMGPKMSILREYDQSVMVCSHSFPQASGRFAMTSDIPRLIEYQHLYNQERSVDERSDWDVLIQQAKVVVHEVDGQIVSIVRFGIQTHRLVSLGGTYTFPTCRRQGYAEGVLAFAVNQIVERGGIAHLIVDTDNTPAIELYRRMGFEDIGSSYIGYLEYS